MLSYTELKKGALFVKDDEPYQVLESSFSRMQQRKAVVQATVRNLRTGKVTNLTLQPSDHFEEAEVEKRPLVFLYQHRGEFIFVDPGDKKNRFVLSTETIGDAHKWLRPNTEVTALFFEEKLLTFTIPIKLDFKVIEAPPGVQGDRAQGGTKAITIETGVTINTPLFINTGDVIRVNTETGEYVERVEKA